VLVKESEVRPERDCVRCGRCVDTCPMGLMPLQFVNIVKQKQFEELPAYHILDCVECGSCAYNCPANIPIVSYIKSGKAELRKAGVK
ncbi:hypothetical protein DRJ12_02345, partial [Candidatus Acetothermia bacterium]